MRTDLHVGVIFPFDDMSKLSNEYYMRVSNTKEEFIKACYQNHLPPPIFRHIEKHGVNINKFVAKYLAKYCLIREHPDGLTEVVFKDKVIGSLRIK